MTLDLDCLLKEYARSYISPYELKDFLIKFATSNKLSFFNRHLSALESDILDESEYNCWGFTSYLLKLKKRLIWMQAHNIVEYLNKYTERIPKTQIRSGDIVRYDNHKIEINDYITTTFELDYDIDLEDVIDDIPENTIEHTAIILKVNKSNRFNSYVITKNGSLELQINKLKDMPYRGVVTYYRIKK